MQDTKGKPFALQHSSGTEARVYKKLTKKKKLTKNSKYIAVIPSFEQQSAKSCMLLQEQTSALG